MISAGEKNGTHGRRMKVYLFEGNILQKQLSENKTYNDAKEYFYGYYQKRTLLGLPLDKD